MVRLIDSIGFCAVLKLFHSFQCYSSHLSCVSPVLNGALNWCQLGSNLDPQVTYLTFYHVRPLKMIQIHRAKDRISDPVFSSPVSDRFDHVGIGTLEEIVGNFHCHFCCCCCFLTMLFCQFSGKFTRLTHS